MPMPSTAKKLADKRVELPKEQIEIGFGLGASDADMSCDDIAKMFSQYTDCEPDALPHIYEAKRIHEGPISTAQANDSYGPLIDFTNQDAPGSTEVYQTSGYKNGEFQRNVLILGVALHVRVPSYSYMVRGNAYLASAFAAGGAPPFSPDVWTLTDQGGAWTQGGVVTSPAQYPAYMDYGKWCNQVATDLGDGYNFRWTWGSQQNIMDEIARHIMHLPDNAMDGSAGLSQQDIFRTINGMNSYYTDP